MRRRPALLILIAIVSLLVGLAGRAAIERMTAPLVDDQNVVFGGAPIEVSRERLDEVEAAGQSIQSLHARLGQPNPGDWRHAHAEPGQSFAEYRSGCPSRPTAQLNTLYIQKWGDFDETETAVVDRVVAFLERFYGIRGRFLEPRSLEDLPDSACPLDPKRGDRRLLAPYVLGELSRPTDAAAVLALTTVDLTRYGGGSWAFGQASLSDRVAVCSLFRQGDPTEDFTLCLRRTLKTAVHEVGHAFSIAHCVAYQCSMNGSNSREEADARPLWFCPEDEMKVWLACNLDPVHRYASLAELAESNGLEPEARFWRHSSQKIRGQASHRK